MQAWENFLTVLRKDLGADVIEKWLRPLKIVRFDAGNLFLEAKDSFQINWFEEHIRKKAKTLFFNNNGRPIKIHLSLANETAKPSAKKTKTKEEEDVLIIPQFSIKFDDLEPLYSFDHFINPSSYPLPYKLLGQITGYKEDPKFNLTAFNPIYLWGLNGTGKTHLLMASAHEMQKKGLSVAFVRAETFTEHVITAIRASEMSLFRQSYRNADVLIIDDVHLFGKKWATQEELFHTFNTLHLAGKQIILSANCPPSELSFVEPRLISRFEWGIVLPLGSLQRIELINMLTTKANILKFPLNQKSLEFLIDTFISGTKALTKAFEVLILRSHLNQATSRVSSTQLTPTMIQQVLGDLIYEEQKSALSPEKIIQQVSAYFGIRPEDILGKAQSRDCVLPRQIAMHLCRSQLKMAFTKIGDLFDKDHSTVMSSVKQIQKGLEDNQTLVSEPLNAILKKLRTQTQVFQIV